MSTQHCLAYHLTFETRRVLHMSLEDPMCLSLEDNSPPHHNRTLRPHPRRALEHACGEFSATQSLAILVSE